jgi:hypothetical protein
VQCRDLEVVGIPVELPAEVLIQLILALCRIKWLRRKLIGLKFRLQRFLLHGVWCLPVADRLVEDSISELIVEQVVSCHCLCCVGQHAAMFACYH